MLIEYISTHSFVRVREAFKNGFPDSEEPPYCTILRFFQKFVNTGSVLDHPRERIRTAWTTTNYNRISDSIDDAVHLSMRRCAQSLNLSQTTVQRLLKELKVYPYHLSPLQELKPSDYRCRVNFYCWLLHLMDGGNNISIFDTSFYSDDAWFHLDGYINSQNY